MLPLYRDISRSEDAAKAYGRFLEKNYTGTSRNSVNRFKAGMLFFQKPLHFGLVKGLDFRRLKEINHQQQFLEKDARKR